MSDDDDFDKFLDTTRREAATAFVRGDASRVVALSAKSGTATFFDPGGHLTRGADNIDEANIKGAASFGRSSTTTLDMIDQGSSGDLGFWTGYQLADVEIGGKMVPMKLRITEVYRRTDGRWLMVHRHASKAIDG